MAPLSLSRPPAPGRPQRQPECRFHCPPPSIMRRKLATSTSDDYFLLVFLVFGGAFFGTVTVVEQR